MSVSINSVRQYLNRLDKEGCTATEVVDVTIFDDYPLVVHHDGGTCPIHEDDAPRILPNFPAEADYHG